jgi:hypothetical protein
MQRGRNFWVTFFHGESYVLSVTKCLGLRFGRFFIKPSGHSAWGAFVAVMVTG